MEYTLTDVRYWLIKHSYIFVIFVLISIITVSGYEFVQQQKQIEIEDAHHDLAIIADLKVSQIVAWRKERLVEASSLYSNAMMSHRIAEYLKGTENTLIHTEIHTWMKDLCDVAGYNNLMLFSVDGKLIASNPEHVNQPQRHYLDRVKTAVQKQVIFLSDLHYDEDTDIIDIDLAIPVMHKENGRTRCIAVLLIEYAPQKYLYPLIKTWPSQSYSGETLLVKRDGNDVLFLNALRFKPDSALKFRVPLTSSEMPAVHAALGQEGLFEGIDYRGVHVIAATRIIPDSPWAIVTKIDMQEILEPVSKRVWYVVGTCILILLASSMALFLWWKRKQEAFLRNQYETEREYNHELKQAQQSLLEANNHLEERVCRRTEELSDSNRQLRQVISERKQIEDKLAQSRKLETIGQIVGGVAHEVRNPLNAILSITEALFREKEIEDNPEYSQYIYHIRTQVKRLANLMNDLLDLSKPISTASLQSVPLLAICRESMELWKVSGMAKNKNGVIKEAYSAAETMVIVDSTKLQQAIFNLLENAGNHSPEGSTIILQVSEKVSDTGMAFVYIIDTGNGIPEDSLCRVFEPFFSKRRGGTGLGLSLVKHYIENMGGSVKIWNNNPPPGCTAELCIPLAVMEHE